jgi:hypothetical protein
MRDLARSFWEHAVPWLQSLGDPEDVRLVFGVSEDESTACTMESNDDGP